MNVEKTQRTTFIFTIWTFLYFSWFRWFMLENWQFNIFSGYAWKSLFNEWWYKGWIIQGSYFWIFIISLFLFIPVWIWGLCFFLTRNYNKYFEKLFWDSIYKKKTKKVQSQNRNIKVKKKKSYREVRPRALTGTPQSIAPITSVEADPEMMNKAPSSAQKLFMEEKLTTSADTSFSSRELSDDFEGESPFSQNAQDFDVSMIASDQKIERLDENLPEIMAKSGAVVIEKPTIENSTIDYMAISKDQVFFVLTDAEKGDWLADEERFNDEDPLWFSETSHRVSPITTLKNFEASFKSLLNDARFQTHIILVKTDGNIINAEDMLDIWRQMNVLVARSNLGMPEELPSFTQTFPPQIEAPLTQDEEMIRSLVQK